MVIICTWLVAVMCTAVLPAGKWVIASRLHNGHWLCLTWFFSRRTNKRGERKEWKATAWPDCSPGLWGLWIVSEKYLFIFLIFFLFKPTTTLRELAEQEVKGRLLPFALTCVSFSIGGETYVTEAMLIRKVLLVLLAWWLIQSSLIFKWICQEQECGASVLAWAWWHWFVSILLDYGMCDR